ncbi:MAG TPA: hypothetical protein P5256_11945 [Beijerinckiaceae bacterium]|nr:hypothetical protein [Rhodoblastus sp.]MCC2106186.1 hypothetical protein [Hyphomicrobiales bacterium]HRY03838.1 hypothetical protein [Beijerinckiaceae bacterium]
MTKTDNPDYVTLPELIAYAREHGCELDAAFQHFRDIGRTAPVAPLAPIRDGWQPPAVTFQFAPAAEERAQRLHSLAAVETAARKGFETLMLSKARRNQKPVSALDFIFSSFAMPDGDYDDGYTISPINECEILIEASVFTTLDAIGDLPVAIPTLESTIKQERKTMPRYKCGNCDWEGSAEELRDIKRYWERVDEDLDHAEPDGECPKCGALAYEKESAETDGS